MEKLLIMDGKIKNKIVPTQGRKKFFEGDTEQYYYWKSDIVDMGSSDMLLPIDIYDIGLECLECYSVVTFHGCRKIIRKCDCNNVIAYRINTSYTDKIFIDKEIKIFRITINNESNKKISFNQLVRFLRKGS